MNVRFLILFLSILCHSVAFAQKAKDYSAVIQDLASRLEVTKMPSQPLRLAIIPFGNTQSSTSNRFGDYVTESIISKLNGDPNKYKIFERKRLDAILKEDELMLSDLMLPEAAQKIGKLVPIDALFSGTYTKLKTYVDLSARLIDVTSGEILVSFSGRIKLTRNLKVLFPLNEQSVGESTDFNLRVKSEVAVAETKDTRTVEEICKERFKEFEIKLNNLSTPEKINAVSKEAMKVPFVNKCGEIHFDVIYYYTRYKIVQPEYESFLIATLDTIALPMLDDRAYAIVKYMARDSIIDARDWKVGLNLISKGNYNISSYVSYLLGRSKSSEQEFKERADAYFAMGVNHKIGLPVALSANELFFEMMEGLPDGDFKRPYVYEKYGSTLTLDTRSATKLNGILVSMYRYDYRPAMKTKIMGWIADFFSNHVDEKSPEHLFDLALATQLTDDAERNKEKLMDYPRADLMLLIDKCRDKFSEYALKSPYKSLQEDCINFCIKYNIPIKGRIPSLSEADAILKGKDLDRQLEVMKMLVQMESRPKSLEGTLTALLSRHNLDEKEKLTEIQTMAIKVLGNIKATQPAAINYMISKLRSFDYDESDFSSEALAKIGQPAVTSLINLLNSTNNQDGGLRYKIVVILGKIGEGAKPAVPSLKKLQAENTNSDIKYAIEAALETIR